MTHREETAMSTSSPGGDWSDDLKEQTRRAVERRDISVPRDGQLCLKHIASGLAVD